jgi:hypothetical protein
MRMLTVATAALAVKLTNTKAYFGMTVLDAGPLTSTLWIVSVGNRHRAISAALESPRLASLDCRHLQNYARESRAHLLPSN